MMGGFDYWYYWFTNIAFILFYDMSIDLLYI